MDKNELLKLAIELALCLADEAVFHGDDDVSEATLNVLSEAREKLNLSREFDEVDSLAQPRRVPVV